MDNPGPILPGREQVVRVAAKAFELLLDRGHPVDVAAIARAVALPVAEAEEAVREAASATRVRRLADGRVHGAIGLDVLPTGHCLRLDGLGPRYTWCAWDVLGIAGALAATGEAASTNPWTGERILLRFEGGRLSGDEGAVLFLAERTEDARSQDWCPYVNFFHSRDDARAWAEAFGIRGRALSLDEGLELGIPRWREALGL